MKQDLPPPTVQTFLVCSDILFDDRTQRPILVNPTHHVPVEHFPMQLRASIYMQLRGGHGRYALDLDLRNGKGNSVWQYRPCEINCIDPIFPLTVDVHDLLFDIPEPGRYDLVALANGQEIGVQILWLGPREFFAAG